MELTKNAKWTLRHNKDKPLSEDMQRRAAAMYRKGSVDAEIALACKCSKQAVLNWRLETGRESNFVRKGRWKYGENE